MDNFIGGRASGKTSALICRAVSTGCDILAPTYPMAENIAETARVLGLEVSRSNKAINSFWWVFSIAERADAEPIRVLVLRHGYLNGIRRHDREVMIDELAIFSQQMLEPYARIRGFSLSVKSEDFVMNEEDEDNE